jgi:DNA-binding NtrC family response regulator
MKVDVRVLAATNRDLAGLVREGKFREDLFYRIRVIALRLPDLSDRREDIPLLVDHLVGRFNLIQGKDIAGVSDEVMAVLMEHDYPGNVRELENIIEQAFVLCRSGMIELHHIPAELRADVPAATPGPARMLISMEKIMILEALNRHGGNRRRTAAELGIHISTLYRKIKALDIETPPTDGRGRRS